MSPKVLMLGRLGVRDGDSWHEPPSHKTVALLAYLAFQSAWVEREELAMLFWPEAEGPRARSNLRSLVARSKAFSWAATLEASGGRVRWRVDCDVHAFRSALDERRWDDATALYRGDLLTGTAFTDSAPFASWLQIEREGLRDAFRTAAMHRVQDAVRAKRHDEAAAQLASLLEVDPLNEDAVRLGMRLYAEAGRPAQAVRLFRAFRDRLADELELEPTVATTDLARAIRTASERPAAPSGTFASLERASDGERSEVLSPSDPSGRAAWPARALAHARVPLTSFIGRDAEIEELSSRLARHDSRLVTVVGTGGVGKTRLALRTAELVAARYAAGTVVVPLEDVTSASRVPAAIADALEVPLRGPSDPVPRLVDAIGDANALLVLDNFEHVLQAAPVLTAVLAGCPRVDILVTSRERLGLAEEWLLPLRGLTYPREVELAGAMRYDAVRCLVERIRQVRPDFVLDGSSIPHVVDVCRLVDGLPLGLELAAVWTRAMPVEEIAAEIDDNLDFLRHDRRAGTQRHRSIRATFEHSWRLLAEAERDALGKLAVFRGGFRRSAAAFVADASIAVLAALVDKSLLRASLDGRYDRHPLVHALTLERLEERPEAARDARERHARYFAWLLEEAEPHRGTERQREWIARLEPDAENMAGALAYAIEREDGDLAMRLLPSLRWKGWPDGRVDERSELASKVLALDPERRHPMRKHALHIAGVLAVNGRRYAAARAYDEEGLALAEASGDASLATWLRTNLATLALSAGDPASARAHLDACLAYRTEVGMHAGVASALNHLGGLERAAGNLERARELHEDALSIGRAIRDSITLCRAFNGLGYVAQARGDLDGAWAHLEEGLAVAEANNHHASRIAALHALAELAHRSGNLRRARDLHVRGLALARSTGTHRLLHRSLDAVAELLAAHGHPIAAARVWGAAQSLREATGIRLPPSDADRRMQRLATARDAAGHNASAFDAAIDAGRALDAAGAVASAVAALEA